MGASARLMHTVVCHTALCPRMALGTRAGHLWRGSAAQVATVNSITLGMALHNSSAASSRRFSVLSGRSPIQAYSQLQQLGELRHDQHQQVVVKELDELYQKLVSGNYVRPSAAAPAVRSGFFGSLFGGSSSPSVSSLLSGQPQGLYIWGGTGCGKTRLMDMFYECVPGSAISKKRSHFHSFMLDVHQRLHASRGRGVRGDPLVTVAQELLAESRLLCFDEFQVTDVGDAMIMRRLFKALWDGGLVMVATSNRPPSQLYANGLQRELFLPFLDDLAGRCSVQHLDSPTDYRLIATPLRSGSTWLSPETVPLATAVDAKSSSNSSSGSGPSPAWAALDAAMDGVWHASTAGLQAKAMDIDVHGRTLHIPQAVVRDQPVPAIRAARTSFEHLCGQALYAADYQALARAYSMVFLDRVPHLDMGNRNEVRRLITLIDVLYDANVKMVVSAAASPIRLFSPTFPVDRSPTTTAQAAPAAQQSHSTDSSDPTHRPGRIVTSAGSSGSKYDEVFAWDRAVSRLLEMQSEEYLAKPWRHGQHGHLGL